MSKPNISPSPAQRKSSLSQRNPLNDPINASAENGQPTRAFEEAGKNLGLIEAIYSQNRILYYAEHGVGKIDVPLTTGN